MCNPNVSGSVEYRPRSKTLLTKALILARKFTFCLVLYKDEKVLESVETLRSEASSDMSRAPRRTSRLSTSGRHKVLAT